MNFEDLTPEFKEKARACSSKEELSELAEALGVKLSDDELAAISGGGTCPKNTGCAHFKVVQHCPPDSSCSDLFDCLLWSCLELAPLECEELFDWSDKNPRGILKTP